MWAVGSVNIDVWEFHSRHVKTKNSHVKPGFRKGKKLRKGMKSHCRLRLTPLKLATALARSGTTLAPGEPTGFLRTLRSYLQVQEFCTGSNRTLGAAPSTLRKLRDSTRTALAGEFGQALTWLIASEHFKQSTIVDFGRGCSLLTPQVPPPGSSDRRPDYLTSSAGLDEVSIFESKGSLALTVDDVNWKEGIVTGLAQAEEGRKRLRANNFNGTIKRELAVSFALTEDSRSTVVFADPEDDDNTPLPESSRRPLALEHLASWASAGGASSVAELFRSASPQSPLIPIIDEWPTVELGSRKMKLLVPPPLITRESEVFPPWPTDTLQLIDGQILRSVVTGDLSSSADAISSYREAMGHFTAEEEERGGAIFSDGTAYLRPKGPQPSDRSSTSLLDSLSKFIEFTTAIDEFAHSHLSEPFLNSLVPSR